MSLREILKTCSVYAATHSGDKFIRTLPALQNIEGGPYSPTGISNKSLARHGGFGMNDPFKRHQGMSV